MAIGPGVLWATASLSANQNSASYSNSLDLSLDNSAVRLLLNPSYVTEDTSIISVSGNDVPYRNHLYTGVVDGVADSWVRVSLNNNKLHGVMSRNGHRFELTTNNSGTILIKPLADNHNSPSGWPVRPATRIRNISNTGDRVTRVARIAIVVDSQYNQRFDGNGLEKALSIINAVDGIYREEFGLALKVVKAINVVDRSNDPFNYGAVPIERMLRNFREYRMNSSDFAGASLVHLFTGNLNSDEPVGLAWINTACRNDGYDVGLSTPYRHDILLAAHEIAHNLGAKHDNETACASQTDKVMWPYISSNTSENFSSCTLESVRASLENSCHTETIDLQVSLSQPNTNTISAIIQNNDFDRANTSAVLTITLPLNTSATAVEGECSLPLNTMECEIGTLLPGANETIVVRFDRVQTKDALVSVIVENPDSADPHPENNQQTIDLSTGRISAASDDPAPIRLATGGNSGINAGSLSIVNLGVLFGLLLLYRIRRH